MIKKIFTYSFIFLLLCSVSISFAETDNYYIDIIKNNKISIKEKLTELENLFEKNIDCYFEIGIKKALELEIYGELDEQLIQPEFLNLSEKCEETNLKYRNELEFLLQKIKINLKPGSLQQNKKPDLVNHDNTSNCKKDFFDNYGHDILSPSKALFIISACEYKDLYDAYAILKPTILQDVDLEEEKALDAKLANIQQNYMYLESKISQYRKTLPLLCNMFDNYIYAYLEHLLYREIIRRSNNIRDYMLEFRTAIAQIRYKLPNASTENLETYKP